MKRIIYLTTIFLSLSLLASCIDCGKVKEKIQVAKEKIAEKKAKAGTPSRTSAQEKALGAILGKKDELSGFVKETGAVLHREYKMDSQNQGLSQFVTQLGAMPTVSVFTLDPAPSLIPGSLEGYKLVE